MSRTKITQTERVHEIALFVAGCRKRAGISLHELGQRAGVTPGFISKVERGAKAPSLDVLFRLVEACGGTVKIEASFGGRR